MNRPTEPYTELCNCDQALALESDLERARRTIDALITRSIRLEARVRELESDLATLQNSANKYQERKP